MSVLWWQRRDAKPGRHRPNTTAPDVAVNPAAEASRTVTIVDDATQLLDVPATWTMPLPIPKPELLPPLPAGLPRHHRHALPDLEPRLGRLRTAMKAAEPEPVVTEVVFHPAISRELWRDFRTLPAFRETARAIRQPDETGQRRHLFANLHQRAPSATSGGKQ